LRGWNQVRSLFAASSARKSIAARLKPVNGSVSVAAPVFARAEVDVVAVAMVRSVMVRRRDSPPRRPPYAARLTWRFRRPDAGAGPTRSRGQALLALGTPKWIAADGKSFWLVWTDFQFIGANRPYYSFNTQKVELVTE
jgi:hypothetical protein